MVPTNGDRVAEVVFRLRAAPTSARTKNKPKTLGTFRSMVVTPIRRAVLRAGRTEVQASSQRDTAARAGCSVSNYCPAEINTNDALRSDPVTA